VHGPNAGDTEFQNNSLGEIEWQHDANGNTTTITYDILGRKFDRTTNGVISGRWRYDGAAPYGRKGLIDYEQSSMSTIDRLTKYYRYATTTGGKDFLSDTAHYVHENGAVPESNKHFIYFYADNNFGRAKGVKFGDTGLTIQYEYTSIGYRSKIKNASSGYVYREITDEDALGNQISGTFGNGAMTQIASFHPATGQMIRNFVTKSSTSATVHELGYDYDGFANLYQAVTTASNGMQNFETFTYDNLHRLTKSSRAYSSLSHANDVTDYTYSSVGNILSKNDYFSGALYGNAARTAGGNAGPNAIRHVTYIGGGTTNYAYDDNGNMLSGDGRTISYNAFNIPTGITKAGVSSALSYGADLMRYKQVKAGLSGGTQTTFYVDKLLEIEKQGTRTTYRHYIDGVAILARQTIGSTTQWTLGYNLKDRLGSVVTLADQDGNVLEHRSYGPFGRPRRGDFLDAGTIQSAIALDPHPAWASDPLTDRGFTDHEHLDEQAVIHMNGRLYDYNIGRFASVDPIIQSPSLSQSINPYSYIMNNPLAGTDPSGYAAQLKGATDVRQKQWDQQRKYSSGTTPRLRTVKVSIQLVDPAAGNGSATTESAVTTTDGSTQAAPQSSRPEEPRADANSRTDGADTVVVPPSIVRVDIAIEEAALNEHFFRSAIFGPDSKIALEPLVKSGILQVVWDSPIVPQDFRTLNILHLQNEMTLTGDTTFARYYDGLDAIVTTSSILGGGAGAGRAILSARTIAALQAIRRSSRTAKVEVAANSLGLVAAASGQGYAVDTVSAALYQIWLADQRARIAAAVVTLEALNE
ncbi:MAG: RHS repeat domain-containing protein, partial [Bacteroidota bacterium]